MQNKNLLSYPEFIQCQKFLK